MMLFKEFGAKLKCSRLPEAREVVTSGYKFSSGRIVTFKGHVLEINIVRSVALFGS